MIKARLEADEDENAGIVLGLSLANLELLESEQPIEFDAAEITDEQKPFFITTGVSTDIVSAIESDVAHLALIPNDFETLRSANPLTFDFSAANLRGPGQIHVIAGETERAMLEAMEKYGMLAAPKPKLGPIKSRHIGDLVMTLFGTSFALVVVALLVATERIDFEALGYVLLILAVVALLDKSYERFPFLTLYENGLRFSFNGDSTEIAWDDVAFVDVVKDERGDLAQITLDTGLSRVVLESTLTHWNTVIETLEDEQIIIRRD